MEIKINKQNIEISQATIDSVIAHAAFISAGTKWLLRNDPYCKFEQEYLLKIKESFCSDIEIAIQTLTPSEQDDFLEEVDFMSNEFDDYLDILIDIAKFEN